MQPRQQFYNFAHRVLKQDAHTEPTLWSILTGDLVISYLQMRWQDAGSGVSNKGLLPVALQTIGDLEIQVINMPPPEAPTEAYFAAFVRSPQQPFPLRYFVCERSSAGGAFWSEWRPNMRIRGADVPMWPAEMARRIELPAPYLAAFVDAIAAEVRAFPVVAEPPAAAPAAKPAAPVTRAPVKTAPAAKRSGANPIVFAMLVIALVACAVIVGMKI